MKLGQGVVIFLSKNQLSHWFRLICVFLVIVTIGGYTAMVQGLTTINKLDHSKSYQHIQGCMIQRLNKLSCDIKLTHSEYRLMGVLIGLYNKQHDKAFPTIAQFLSLLPD